MSSKAKTLLPLILFVVLFGTALGIEDPLIGRARIIELADAAGQRAFDTITSQIANDPYNPGSYAWGWQYHARGCLIMYELTGRRKWLDWALNLTDLFLLFSDVNNDGIPAWGNYNETWGNPRYAFREYTVWDGVIGLPMIEAAKIIRSDPILRGNESLAAKADAYIDLIQRIVVRHHGAWTQVSEDQGYYWDDPNEDVGPIVNRFTALGRVELVLGDLSAEEDFYQKPLQMANYMIANMQYHEGEDLYTWEYWYGQGGSEDISHGAIELEFLIMASERGLLDQIHLQRLARTYLKRIWQVPQILDGKHILAMRVDGTDPPEDDYTRISRGWVLLTPYNLTIYDAQRTAFGILHEVSRVYPSSVSLLGLAQIAMTANRLDAMGIDPDGIRSVDLPLLNTLLHRAEERLNATMASGSEAVGPRAQLEEAAGYASEDGLVNASIAIGLLLKAWESLGRISETGELLGELEADLAEAAEMGVPTSELDANASAMRLEFRLSDTNSELEDLDSRVQTVIMEVERLVAERLIERAEEAITLAKELGIDTSRHELFLTGAKEHFDKGNYGSVRHLTGYPLALMEQIGEGYEGLPALIILPTLLLGTKFIFIVGQYGGRDVRRP